MKYKAGQKVRVREDLKSRGYTSESGVIKANVTLSMLKLSGKTVVIKDVNPLGIYHIENLPSCGWVAEMFEPIHNEKIVVTSDGVTTTARKYDGKNLIKEAKAVCSKDDEFNFDVGAKLAMERLMKEDKPKLYNGKVVCIEVPICGPGFTKGKIYRFEEGFMLDDDNEVRPTTGIPVKSFEDLKKKLGCQFLEVVE